MNINPKLFIIYDYYGRLKLLPDHNIYNSNVEKFFSRLRLFLD